MTGMVVTSRPGGAAGAVVWFVIAVGLVGLAVATQNPHWGIFAVLPGVLGLAAFLSTEPAVEFEVADDGLSFQAPWPVFIPYDEIQGLTAPGNRSSESFPIQVYHRGGVVRIPARIDVPSRDLYDFILDQLPVVGSADPDHVPAGLRGFLTDQLALFGPEKVYVYRARPFAPVSSQGRAIKYSLACALVGVLWIAVGGVMAGTFEKRADKDAMGVWIGVGVLFVLMGLLFALLFYSRSRGASRVQDWRNSCLIVTPAGIALHQGALKGKLRWEELRAVEFPAKHRFALASAGGVKYGIGLLVEGAYLVIADYYDRPLAMIRDQLRAYWGGRHAN